MSLCRRITTPTLIFRTLRKEITSRGLHNTFYKNVNITSTPVESLAKNVTHNVIRFKSKKSTQHDSDDEDEQFDSDDSSLTKDSKVVKFNTTSMRTDIILKSALGVARNKVEQMFYESKIRLNGKKIIKKSAGVRLGDEIDIIKMVSPKNPDHLYVARIEIVNIVPSEENIIVTARRFKNLLIENYEADPYKSSVAEEA